MKWNTISMGAPVGNEPDGLSVWKWQNMTGFRMVYVSAALLLKNVLIKDPSMYLTRIELF